MIIKNLTFVVPIQYEADFLSQVFKATDAVSQWVEDIRAYKIVEQLDPESFNFAVQLGFTTPSSLEAFNVQVLEDMIGEIQAGVSEPVLYFESHLEKIF
ncbi:MAG: hypothetical protein KF870_16745 [Leadbetterella sp.]|nr:hypothetical protein [Leadbetterella sp.]